MRLTDVNLLNELRKPEYRALRDMFRERSCPKGEIVSHPYEAQDQVFVLASGRLRVYFESDEREFILAILEPGAVYATHTRAYVAALEDSTLLVAETNRLHAILKDNPALGWAMINVLGGLLKNSFSIISGLAFRDVSHRLVIYLLNEVRHIGERGEDGRSVLIRTGLTTEQLAQVVGSTRQTVSMLLGDLMRSGLLDKVGHGEYLVRDVDRLRALLH